MSSKPNVIPFCGEFASASRPSQVQPVLSTPGELDSLQEALRARNVLVAHYGRHWLLSGAAHNWAIVFDPETLEYHSLDGKILSGHVTVLCESERVELLADVVGAVAK